MTDKTGGPAFPQGKGLGDAWIFNGGMTMRDFFAAKVIQGMVANDEMVMRFGLDAEAEMIEPDVLMATAAYRMADAMLKERSK